MTGRRLGRVGGAARRVAAMSWRDRATLAVAIVVVPAVRVAVRVSGFGPTAARLARWSDTAPHRMDRREARAIASLVGLVAARPLVGASCLPRSLATWFLLRRRGGDVVLVIGGSDRVDSFTAHAWVELDGHVVNDVPDVRDRFGAFDVQLPRLSGRFG